MNLYFNNAFSKQPLKETVQSMQTYLSEEFENPLTESESAERARGVLRRSRESVAALIRAKPQEIVFVSSGTEANNWALKGTAQAWVRKKNHFIISAIEHFSVYQTAQFLNQQGFELTILPVSHEGLLDPGDLEKAIRPSTFLVSIQSASDEIGVTQNLEALAEIKQKFSDIVFHTDAVQYNCYENLNLDKLPFDLVSLSSNAICGPPGVAALYIREGTRIVPLFHGGMQEEGLRPGLQSIALIAGFGSAAQLNFQNKSKWKERLRLLQTELFQIFDRLNVRITGSRTRRLVDNVHGIVDVDGEALLTLLLESGIRTSSGSTCYEYAQKESHVLKALEINSDIAKGAILLTLGIDQTIEDIRSFSGVFEESLVHLRRLKPKSL